MSTKKLFACVVAVLVLLYASGCCETNDCYPVRSVAMDCNQPIVSQPTPCQPVVQCPPAVTHPVINCQQYVKCRPARKPKQVRAKKVRYVNCLQPTDHCYLNYDPCVGNPPLLCDSTAVRQVAVVAPAPVVVTRQPVVVARPRPVVVDCAPAPQIVQEPKVRKVRGRTRTVIPVVNNNVSGSRTQVVYAPAPVVGGVQPQPVYLPAASAPAIEDGPIASIPSTVFEEEEPKPVAIKPAPVKPAPAAKKAAAKQEPKPEVKVELVTEEPVAEAKAAAAAAPGTLLAQVQEQPSSVRRIDSVILEEPVREPVRPVAPVVAPVPAAPAVRSIPSVQPVLEPIPAGAQARRMPPPPASLMTQMPLVEPYEAVDSSVAGARAGQQQETWNPVCAPAQPDEPKMTSTYCPPEICPVPFAPLCEPNQNMSDCFSMNDNQLMNSPQVFTPNAMTPLPIPIPPPPPQEFKTAPAAAPVPAPVAATWESSPSKYEALPPVAESQRPDMRRVELSMPPPLGTGNIPPVPAPSEIESAVDAMLSRDTGMSSVPGVQPNLK